MGNAAPPRLPTGRAAQDRNVGPVLTVGLNRPAKRNALNDGIILAIEDCFANLPENIGAVVIHGIGDHFSSGLDLSELTEHDATEGLRHSQMWHRVFDRIQYSRVPVIAALKGAVIGGGLELACAAHIRVAEPQRLFRAARGPARHFRRRRRIGAVAAADRRRPDDRHDADRAGSIRRPKARRTASRNISPKRAARLPRRWSWPPRSPTNAPLTNFAVLQALPMIAEANPQTGLLMESLMATVAQSDKEAKRRIRAFLDRKTAKVKPA